MDRDLLAGIIRALEGRGVRVMAILDGSAPPGPEPSEGAAAEPDDERKATDQPERDG